jgi:pimeloyl-ACP methyl ester carboxylesterase
LGRVDDVRSGDTRIRRSDSLYSRPDPLMGHSTDGISPALRTRSVPRDFKTRFPASLTLRPKQLRAAAEESAFLIPMAAKFQSYYPSIQCPVHIFHGTADQLIEPEQARYLHRALPGSVLHLVEDAGHMVTYADGAGIAEAVDAVAGRSNISRLNIR